MSQLVLSVFPGIDMLGKGFEQEGFCVVRGPDLIFGGDIREFKVLPGRFDGVIGGSPCPDFSKARRSAPTGNGLEMLGQFRRVVEESESTWFLLENVPGCPDLKIPGYSHQRIDLDARDVGLSQRRLRHFQFGHSDGLLLTLPRSTSRLAGGEATCTASEGGQLNRRSWPDFCELQGLERDFDLPSFTQSAKYRAVGNGVPPAMGAFLARAILNPVAGARICACGCARPVAGKAVFAGPACRKRAQRLRDVTDVDLLAAGESHVTYQV